MSKNDYCGIYKIENLVNGKIYIGQSKHIRQRWTEHKKELRGNRHRNQYLQRAWNKYGEDKFRHEILELCNENQLDELEIYYIELLQTFNSQYGYNLTSGGGTNKQLAESTRQKLSINATGANNSNSKKVISLEDNMIYDSINIASKECNTQPAMIFRCCIQQRNTAGKKHWMYYSDYINSTPEERQNILFKKSKERPVIYLNTMTEYPSIKLASEDTGVNCNSIGACCSHSRPRAGCTPEGIPRIFMYLDEYHLINQAV